MRIYQGEVVKDHSLGFAGRQHASHTFEKRHGGALHVWPYPGDTAGVEFRPRRRDVESAARTC